MMSDANTIVFTPLVGEYLTSLSGKALGTRDAYHRALRQFTDWVAERPGSQGAFHPDQFTRTAVETYLKMLETKGYSVSHRARVKSAASSFAQWLMEEKGLLRRNPTRGVAIPAQPLLAPRQLSPDQRYVLSSLIERDGAVRSEALFALGYWAGCRVSDVAWLRVDHAHIGPKVGWLHLGHKGGKTRDVDIHNEVRKPLAAYLVSSTRDKTSAYVFTSQRGERLTEAGIHHWFRTLKTKATKGEWELLHDISFHDLRHDFAHRARESGWALEEVAYYLGHVTKKGTPAIQTTARYTQVSREQVREKVRRLSG
jgi:site-specific recombinase XerD